MYLERLALIGILLLPLMMLAASAGCRSSLEQNAIPVDRSLLSGEPCEPPCWQGLVPGVSTEEEVNEFVRSSEFVDQASVFRGEITRGRRSEVVGVSVQWWSTANMANVPRQLGNFADIIDGLLQSLTIWLDCEVTLQDLLERYGSPDKFTAHMQPSAPPYVSVVLYFASHGFTAELTLQPDDLRLQSETEVLYVVYLPVAPLDEFLDQATYGASAIEETAQDWQGYGPIELIP